MTTYTRRQLVVLLLLVVAAAAGLAIQRWRHANPALVERVERFDREPAAEPPPPARAVPAPAATRPPGLGDRAARESPPLDLNHASEEELRRLPGVGPVLAARIVEARASAGPFTSVDDLRKVRGVGGTRLDRLRPFLAPLAPAP
jgi:competence protein ComEA